MKGIFLKYEIIGHFKVIILGDSSSENPNALFQFIQLLYVE